MWHCPNALCTGPGGAWFRRTLDSFQEAADGRHTVDEKELYKKGSEHNKINGIKVNNE